MKIVDIVERAAPMHAPIRNAWIDFSQMTASTVAVVTDVMRDGRLVIGYGFNSNGRYAASGIVQERLIPRLRRAPPEALVNDDGTNLDPFKIWDVMMTGEKPGGHGERSVAVGTIDMAVWDAVAKIEGQPLYRLLANRFGSGTPDERVFTYAAGGYYAPGKDLAALQDEMRAYLALGYTVVKMKVGGAPLDEDLRRIEAVLAVVGDGSALMVDVNGRFTLDEALHFGAAIAPYGLRWYEEPCDPLDYDAMAQLAARYDGPLATGENLFSFADARNLVRYGGMRADRDWLQFDPVLSYGLVEYLRILAMLPEYGWSARRCIPHGGHQFALGIAAGLGLGGNESYPQVFAPFGGFADNVPIDAGYARLPDIPGIGFEAKPRLMEVFRLTAA